MPADNYESIVTTMDRPVLVLAGPGAGKTYLLGDRVKRLLDAGVARDKVILLTFAKDASQNMREMLLDKKAGFGIPYKNLPHVATLHSLGLEIVNRKPRAVRLRKTDLRVQSDDRVKQLLFRDAAFILGHKEHDAEIAIQKKQNGKLSENNNDISYSICTKYWEIMSKCNSIDFDDQINFACKILENDQQILAEYQQRSKHLLVDEYQDINAPQFRLIELLSRPSRNGLFAVGDDAQSIYGFRGADPGLILRFEEDYPGASVPPLAESRRCPQKIMDNAARVLKTYYPRWTGPFNLRFHVQSEDEPFIWHVPSDNAEAEWVSRIARQAVADKKTALVLAPRKEFFPRISRALHRFGVPHRCPVSLLPEQVTSRLQTIASILEWLNNPEDNFLARLAVESVLNHGVAKVPGANKARTSATETIARREQVESEVANLWEEVNKEKSLLSTLLGSSTSSEPIRLVQQTLRRLISTYSNSRGKFDGEFAKQLSLTIGDWVDPSKLSHDLLAINELTSAGLTTGFGSVQLMTMRRAKGLEADVVIIVGLEDDLHPNPNSDLTEEARLFYVSMTRAKEKVYLIHSFKRLRSISHGPEITNKKRSRFLDTIGRPSKYMQTTS